MIKKLSSERRAVSRMRKKINPEYGRQPDDGGLSPVLTRAAAQSTFKCPRGLILQAPAEDWMEWQASYAGGALLMPLSSVTNMVRTNIPDWNGIDRIPANSPSVREIVNQMGQTFDISPDAAQVRLTKLRIIQPTT